MRYADYAIWQRRLLAGPFLQRLLDYWKGRLAGAPSTLGLPTDHPRPRRLTFDGARYQIAVPRRLSEKLQKLGEEHGHIVHDAAGGVQGAAEPVNSGQEDVVVGAPVANRRDPRLKDLIGIFVNTLVLRTDLSGEPSFLEVLARVRHVVLEALDHEDLPFELLVDELCLERDESRHPLFEANFALQNAPREQATAPGLHISYEEVANETARFDLAFDLRETAEGLIGFIDYSSDLFQLDTIVRMADHFLSS